VTTDFLQLNKNFFFVTYACKSARVVILGKFIQTIFLIWQGAFILKLFPLVLIPCRCSWYYYAKVEGAEWQTDYSPTTLGNQTVLMVKDPRIYPMIGLPYLQILD